MSRERYFQDNVSLATTNFDCNRPLNIDSTARQTKIFTGSSVHVISQKKKHLLHVHSRASEQHMAYEHFCVTTAVYHLGCVDGANLKATKN